MMNIIVERFDDRAIMPTRHGRAAGVDVYACLFDGDPENGGKPVDWVILKPGETKLIHTGIKLGLPDGVMVDMRPRSGISLNTPLRICNTPGTIDCDYKNPVGVALQNTSRGGTEVYDINTKGNQEGSYIICTGDKIAQMIPMRQENYELYIGIATDAETGDRGGGYGSSGNR